MGKRGWVCLVWWGGFVGGGAPLGAAVCFLAVGFVVFGGGQEITKKNWKE